MTAIETEVGPVVGKVQTDTFCPGCGYNLHTQAVLRDERLGILICRCPECGRFAAAGQTTTAARVWLNRLAGALLAGWICFVLLLFALCALFLGMLAYGHTMEMTEFHQVTAPPAKNQAVALSPAPAVPRVYRYEYRIRQFAADDVDGRRQMITNQVILGCLAGALGMLTGVLFAALLWHVNGAARLLAFLPVAVGCGLVAFGWNNDLMTAPIRDWGLRQIGFYFLLESVAVGIGLLIGRPIARGLVRLLVPPKPRQHLAFLWIIDGKTMTPD
jgi:hypothetical protein